MPGSSSNTATLKARANTFLRSVDIDFCNPHAWAALAGVYDEMQEPEHAVEASRQALRSEPENPRWDVLLAAKLMDMDKMDAARESLDKAIEKNAKLSSAWFYRAMIRAEASDRSGALEDLAQACALEPGLAETAGHYETFDDLKDDPAFPKIQLQGGADNPFANIVIETDDN